MSIKNSMGWTIDDSNLCFYGLMKVNNLVELKNFLGNKWLFNI